MSDLDLVKRLKRSPKIGKGYIYLPGMLTRNSKLKSGVTVTVTKITGSGENQIIEVEYDRVYYTVLRRDLSPF